MAQTDTEITPDDAPTGARAYLDLAFYAIIVALAWIANRTPAPWRTIAWVAFWAACLGLPLLDGCRLSALLSWRRGGWRIVAAMIVAGILVGYLWLWIFTPLVYGFPFRHPPIADTLRFLGGQILLWAPLALAEEVFFRGYVQQHAGARRWGNRSWGPVAIRTWFAAALFGAAHLAARPSFVGAWTLLGSGLVLGWIMQRSEGSVWPAVALHAAGNIGMAWLRLLSTW